MSEVLDRLEHRLNLAGWEVRDRDRGASVDDWVTPFRWLLESRRPPVGVRVELQIRLYERQELGYYYDYYWTHEYLTGVTVRFPRNDPDATSGPEPTLVGMEIEENNYRRLIRILEWFRDPLSGNFWHEPPQGDDWVPPVEWLAQRWGPQATLEQRWAICTDGQEMLRFMPGKASDRKLQLIACACARLLRLATLHERNLAAIAAAERYADGLCPRREMKKLCKHSNLPWLAQLEPLPLALQAVRLAGEDHPAQGPKRAADVVRDAIGNPFRPIELRHEWMRNLGGVVGHLVETIAEEGRYDEIPILADALEDAGCTTQAVLDHCRGPGPHVRGCWVIDLLRGKH